MKCPCVSSLLVLLLATRGGHVFATPEDPSVSAVPPERRAEIAQQAMADGERFWREGNREQAEDAFETALGIWEGLEADYPGWESHLIRSRILQAETAIRKVRDGLSFSEPAEDSQSPKVPTLQELAAVADKQTAAALTALKAGIAERDELLRQQREENRRLNEEKARLQSKITLLESRTGKAEDFPGLARAVRSEARRLLERGEFGEAISLLEEGVKWFSQEPSLPHLLAVAYCQGGRFEDALRVLSPLIRWGRGNAEVWVTVGVAYLGLENLGRARWAFEKAIRRDPRSADAHYNLASVLIKLPKAEPEEAAAHYAEARELGLPADQALEEEIRRAILWQRTQSLRK